MAESSFITPFPRHAPAPTGSRQSATTDHIGDHNLDAVKPGSFQDPVTKLRSAQAPQDASTLTLLASTDATPRPSAYASNETKSAHIHNLHDKILSKAEDEPRESVLSTATEYDDSHDQTPQDSTNVRVSIVERAARALLHLDLDTLDALVTRFSPAFVRAQPTCTQKRIISSQVYSSIIWNVIGCYPRARRQDAALAEHLAAVALETYRFMVERDLDLNAGSQTDRFTTTRDARSLALAIAEMIAVSPILSKSVRQILSCIDPASWNVRCHELALDWELSVRWPPVLRSAESRINTCVYELLSRSYVSPQKIDQEIHAMVQAIAETETGPNNTPLASRDIVRLVRWTRLRLRYEETWRWYVRVIDIHDWNAEDLPLELVLVRSNALDLFHAIVILGRAFEQYAYVWYLFETSNMMDMRLMVAFMAACREAYSKCLRESNDDQCDVWEARAWVVYCKIGDFSSKRHRLYVPFMIETIGLVTQIDNLSRRFRLLNRLYRDMETQCSSDYFPITERVFEILVKECWDHANDSGRLGEWEMMFDRMMGIYMLEERLIMEKNGIASGSINSIAVEAPAAQDDESTWQESSPQIQQTASPSEKPSNVSSDAKPLLRITPPTFVLLLKVCTVSGHLDSFRLLNRDLHSRRLGASEEYITQVKKGYAEYMAKYILSKETQMMQVGDGSVGGLRDRQREGSDLVVVGADADRIPSVRSLGHLWSADVVDRGTAVVVDALADLFKTS